MNVNVTVVYYSSTGTTYQIAQELATECTALGANVRLRRAGELAPSSVVESKVAWRDHLASTKNIPEATQDDVLWADGVLFGTPTRFGNVSSQLKQFIDTLGGAWVAGHLKDKAYGAFTTGGSTHGGMETTLSSMNNLFCHFGGVIVPPAVNDPALAAGGNPYGTSHVPSRTDTDTLTQDTRARARYQAQRMVAVAGALKSARRTSAHLTARAA